MRKKVKTQREEEIDRKLNALAVALAQLAKGDLTGMLATLEEAWKEK